MMKRLIALLLITTLLLPSFSFAKDDESRRRRHSYDDKTLQEQKEQQKEESDELSPDVALAVGGAVFLFSGIFLLILSSSLKSESEKPLEPKCTAYYYYYGSKYCIDIDEEDLKRQYEDRKNKAEQSDTTKTLGIIALSTGIVLLIVGSAMSANKLDNSDNHPKGNFSFTYNNDTSYLIYEYRF